MLFGSNVKIYLFDMRMLRDEQVKFHNEIERKLLRQLQCPPSDAVFECQRVQCGLTIK